MDCSTPGSSISRTLLRFTSTELVMLYNHLILCRPLLLLTLIFPSIRVLSNKLSLHIRWPVPLFCNTSEIHCSIFNFLSKRVLNFLKSYKNNRGLWYFLCTNIFMVNVLPHLLSLSPSVVYNMCICICTYAYIHTCIPGRTPSLKTMLNSLLLKPLKTFNKNRKQIPYVYLPTEKIKDI